MNLGKAVVALLIVLVLAVAAGSYYTPNTSGGMAESQIKDSDGDNLNDSYESKIGTSKYSADTDGDGLLDNWEVQNSSSEKSIPESDPLQKDLYLQINYGENVTHLTDSEIQQLKDYWAEMPVANPDGTNGIDLHIDDTPPEGGDIVTDFSLDGYGVGSISYKELRNLARAYYGGEESVQGNISANRRCAYHQMILVESRFPYNKGDNFTYTLGKAIPGGKFSIIMGDSKDGTVMIGPKHPSRLSIMTHELLHNVAGGYHTNSSSWLAPTTPGMASQLSDRTKNDLTDGFNVSSCG
ncbi:MULTISPECIES: hypothetical protein [Halobacterium]|uniref:hypothetical protein n=1 Tax=Halobacterium TaxID=2239 RepID=UPI000B01320D|nr:MULTISPECIES: hypothetical protein [Halobacterium]MCG1001875.1 hypothetical protein [Halobacterium noricense]